MGHDIIKRDRHRRDPCRRHGRQRRPATARRSNPCRAARLRRDRRTLAHRRPFPRAVSLPGRHSRTPRRLARPPRPAPRHRGSRPAAGGRRPRRSTACRRTHLPPSSRRLHREQDWPCWSRTGGLPAARCRRTGGAVGPARSGSSAVRRGIAAAGERGAGGWPWAERLRFPWCLATVAKHPLPRFPVDGSAR